MCHAQSTSLMRHHENSVLIDGRAEDVFAYIDDHTRFSAHMSRSSWMMGGGRMATWVDDGHGQNVGSHIRMNGKVVVNTLSLDEVGTRHQPPRLKTWETVGDLRLLVIGHYRMSVEVEPRGGQSLLRVSIDYDLPPTNVWLGRLFGGTYAKWCVRQMTKGARDHFATQAH